VRGTEGLVVGLAAGAVEEQIHAAEDRSTMNDQRLPVGRPAATYSAYEIHDARR